MLFSDRSVPNLLEWVKRSFQVGGPWGTKQIRTIPSFIHCMIGLYDMISGGACEWEYYVSCFIQNHITWLPYFAFNSNHHLLPPFGDFILFRFRNFVKHIDLKG
jgi:hypothetical protein